MSKFGGIDMTDTIMYAKIINNSLDMALKLVEDTNNQDTSAGEIITPDKFSRGYILGYAHALQRAYDALPEYVLNDL